MDKKTKILLSLFSFCVAVAIVLTYVRVYVVRDYSIQSEVECDPSAEACFVRHCEEDCESEDEVTYYKIQTVEARALPVCDPHKTECPEVICNETATCVEMLCTEENLPEGEECSSLESSTAEEGAEETLTPIELPSSVMDQAE